MTDASRDEIVEVIRDGLAVALVGSGVDPRRVPQALSYAQAALAALEAKGWKLVKGSHGISHGREGYDYGPGSADASHPSRDATEDTA